MPRFHHWNPNDIDFSKINKKLGEKFAPKKHVYHSTGCFRNFGTAMYAITKRGAQLSLQGYNTRKFGVDHYGEYSNHNDLHISCYQPPICDVARNVVFWKH